MARDKGYSNPWAENGPSGVQLQRALQGASKEIATTTSDAYTSIRPASPADIASAELLVSITNMDTTAANFVRFNFWTSGAGAPALGVTHQVVRAGEKLFTVLKGTETHIVLKAAAGTPTVRVEFLNADI